ncbi:MAG: hypothetical protein F9K23_02635 [Bacteroidetes bacterium]|nr:MAG: hypothetical protein F9K23_02635 [Bacteroidota bacterium]
MSSKKYIAPLLKCLLIMGQSFLLGFIATARIFGGSNFISLTFAVVTLIPILLFLLFIYIVNLKIIDYYYADLSYNQRLALIVISFISGVSGIVTAFSW